MSSVDDPPASAILAGLRSRDPRAAWTSFLDVYSPVILEVVRLFERDEDDIGNCYLFVCEQLRRDRFRRLRRFRTDGPASFQTWLRAVVRNLCLDWHRQEFGRQRPFEAVARLPRLEQEIYKVLFIDCLPAGEAYLEIAARIPGLTVEQFDAGVSRVQLALTSRQRWLLSVRRARAAHRATASDDPGEEALLKIPSETLNPESWTALQEARTALLRAMAGLSPRERLLVRLRFEQDLSLEEIAKLLRLGTAQSADRRIREVVGKLRKNLDGVRESTQAGRAGAGLRQAWMPWKRRT